ncbi:MAG: hypothetical protein WAM71_00530 [Candidatus Korobacteraceae bacterium]
MKSNIITALAAVVLLMCSAAVVQAQDNANQNQQTPARHHMTVGNNNETATGCLQQDSNSNGYTLQAQDGTTWQLTSNAMNLGTYVGKEVSVAGTETQAKGDHVRRVSSSQNGNEHGPMDVLDLAVVHESCQQ